VTVTTRLVAATGVYAAVQLVHGLVPADTEAESYVGLVAGLVQLVATLAALYGLRVGAAWAERLAGAVGVLGAVGITAYHLTPVTSPATNPYVGEGVGAAAWLSVLAVVAGGLWTAAEAWRGRSVTASAPGPTG